MAQDWRSKRQAARDRRDRRTLHRRYAEMRKISKAIKADDDHRKWVEERYRRSIARTRNKGKVLDDEQVKEIIADELCEDDIQDVLTGLAVISVAAIGLVAIGGLALRIFIKGKLPF